LAQASGESNVHRKNTNTRVLRVRGCEGGKKSRWSGHTTTRCSAGLVHSENNSTVIENRNRARHDRLKGHLAHNCQASLQSPNLVVAPTSPISVAFCSAGGWREIEIKRQGRRSGQARVFVERQVSLVDGRSDHIHA
jgi:hypothetical protein